ncbi:hypothetical protein SNE40_012511 [Patella caerulea]|uniref:G-protein coupled receptors family 1 profile domain-containing protein n=1 Tax=Patella caerulea TaxID=87958 RepID=A0AAN8JRF6_PATCE
MDNTSTYVTEEFIEERIAVFIWKYSSPVLIILGTIGNILVIAVLSCGKIRKSTTNIYFTAMAVCDILVLYTGLLRLWIQFTFNLDIRHVHPAICKIHRPLVTFSLQTSAWILVAMTIERYLSVVSPHTIKTRCTRRMTLIILSSIVVVLVGINIHFVFGLGDLTLVGDNNETFVFHCDSIQDDYYKFTNDIWPWIDVAVYCFVPFGILSVFNMLILSTVFKGKRDLNRGTGCTLNANSTKRISSLITTLFLINIVYFICTTPISVFMIGNIYWAAQPGTHLAAVQSLVFAIVNQFQYLNNVCNFILYCFSGSNFREWLKSLCSRRRTDRNRTLIGGMGSTKVTPV